MKKRLFFLAWLLVSFVFTVAATRITVTKDEDGFVSHVTGYVKESGETVWEVLPSGVSSEWDYISGTSSNYTLSSGTTSDFTTASGTTADYTNIEGDNISALNFEPIDYTNSSGVSYYRICRSFATDISAIGATEMTLIIVDSQTITSSVTTPSTLRIQFLQGGMLTPNAGVTVAVNSPDHITASPRQQITGGAGNLVFINPGRVYPEWWGAKGDGTTDDSAALQKAIDSYLGKGLVIELRSHYLVNSNIDITNRDGIVIEGIGLSVGSGIGATGAVVTVNHAGIGFDLTGSDWLTLRDFTIQTKSGTSPTYLMLLARASDGDQAGNHRFERMMFYDWNNNIANALVYNYGSEVNDWDNCFFGVNGEPAIVITQRNVDSVSSPNVTIATGAQSTLENAFRRCYISSRSTASPIEIEGGGAYTFDSCYMVTNNTTHDGYVIKLREAGTAYTYVQGLWIENCQIESRIITGSGVSDQVVELDNFSFEDCRVDADVTTTAASGTTYTIDLDYSNAAAAPSGASTIIRDHMIKNILWVGIDSRAYSAHYYTLELADLDLTSYKTANNVELTVSHSLQDSKILAYDDNEIDVSNASLVGTSIIECLIDGGGGTISNGIATIPNGSTSVVVQHGLVRTVSTTDIQVTPTNQSGATGYYHVESYLSGDTAFQIVVQTAPGPETATFVWKADVR